MDYFPCYLGCNYYTLLLYMHNNIIISGLHSPKLALNRSGLQSLACTTPRTPQALSILAHTPHTAGLTTNSTHTNFQASGLSRRL